MNESPLMGCAHTGELYSKARRVLTAPIPDDSKDRRNGATNGFRQQLPSPVHGPAYRTNSDFVEMIKEILDIPTPAALFRTGHNQ